MDDARINLEGLLLSYYIRYDKLLSLCNMTLSDISTNTVDIYVDIYDMLKPIYTRDVYANKKFLIVSSIINLAAHLRGYFWSRHHLNTRIFLVYGESITMQHKQFYPTFGDDKFRETMDFSNNDKFIHDQLEMVKILCGYIYDVYYVAKKSSFSMFTIDNIMKNPHIPSIIITKSKYAYQIPALLTNAKIFRPKKSKGDDTSYPINFSNVYSNFFNKITFKETLEGLSKISPSLLSLMMTLVGLPSYGIPNILSVSAATKRVLDAIDSNRIVNGYNSDIDFVYKALNESRVFVNNMDTFINATSFKYRFNAIDILTQHRIYNSTAEAIDISWMVNFNDPETMRNINNRYFIGNPLDLNNL